MLRRWVALAVCAAAGSAAVVREAAVATRENLGDAELSALIQQQVSVVTDHTLLSDPVPAETARTHKKRRHADGSASGSYSGFLCAPQEEGCQFHAHISNGTGRLHKMAHHSRWVGWKHLSEGHHTNGAPSHKHLTGDVGIRFFSSAPPREWIILVVVCIVLCAIDGMVLRHAPDTFRWHLAVILIWVLLAAAYMWGVWARMGRQYGVEWISGYILEWMLSMDNLFIFHLVFQSYKTPLKQMHKAVFIGIIGAVVMRLVFFMVVSTLLHAVGWFRWPFGAMLVWSGIEAVRGEDDDDGDIKDTRLVRFLNWVFGDRIMDGYDEEGTDIIMWNKKTGKLQLSLLFVVIFIVEFSDIIFALDSVSAKVAQIPNQYVAFSSSVLAMYGLRAMFFIVQDLVQMFDLLKYGLGVILVLIGIELMFGQWLHIGSGVECAIIVGIFAVCVVASHIKQKFWPDPEESEAAEDESQDADGEKEGKKPKAGAGKDDAPEESKGPLSGLQNGPEGDEVQGGDSEGKAWTIHEGRRMSDEIEKKGDGAALRAQSEPARVKDEQ